MAKIYWRTIKRGTRKFTDVPEVLRADIIELAKKDVAKSTITADDYKRYIGEDFIAE